MANIAPTYQNLGEYTKAENLNIKVLDARKRVLGVEHPDTIRAMANLAATCQNLEKYTEAERLDIQVLDARTRLLGVEHPSAILAMENLAATLKCLDESTETDPLVQAHECTSRAALPHTVMNSDKKGM